MKDKKGFTLIEILAVFLILAIIGGAVVLSYTRFFKSGEEDYYHNLESSILLAGNDYYTDHRDELPMGGTHSEVLLTTLMEEKYIEEVKDTKGNVCTEGKVIAYRDNNNYKYEACLIDCGEYSSSGYYCSGNEDYKIKLEGRTSESGETYVITDSYVKAKYVNNENIIVTISMDYANVTIYKIYDSKNNLYKNCEDIKDGNTCEVEIDKSGTYNVVAYNGNEKLASRYMSIKIAGDGPLFHLEGETKYILNQTECSNNIRTKRIKVNIVPDTTGEEYKSISYKIDNGDYQELDNLTIEDDLESGHHIVEVIITNHADQERSETFEFDVAYVINLVYEVDNTKEEHEVVYNKNYNYLNNLPTEKMINNVNVPVGWFKDTNQVYQTTKVEEKCSFTLIGKTTSDYGKTYTIKYYNGNGKSNEGATLLGTSTCTFGTACKLKTYSSELGGVFPYSEQSVNVDSTYKKRGWSFYGWTIGDSGKTKEYNDGASINPGSYSETLELYSLGRKQYCFSSGIKPTNHLSCVYQYWNPYSTNAIQRTSINIPSPVTITSWTFLGYVGGSDSASNGNVDFAANIAGTTYNPIIDTGSTGIMRSKYSRTLTVNYKPNEGSGTTTSTTKTQYYNSGRGNNSTNQNSGETLGSNSITLASSNFTRSGYVFDKWAEGSTGGTKFAAGDSYTGIGIAVNNTTVSKNMYAIWKKDSGDTTFDYNENTTYATDAFLDTGYKVDWSRSFKITAKFSIQTLSKRQLIVGNYISGQTTTLNLEVTTGNKLRVYMGYGDIKVDRTAGSIPKGKTITLIYNWNATTKEYSLTATGDGMSDISMSGALNITGVATKALRTNNDHRGNGTFTPLTINKLSITDTRKLNTTYSDLPTITKAGTTYLGWYTAKSGGSKVTTSTKVDGDTTFYIRRKLTCPGGTTRYNTGSSVSSGISCPTGSTAGGTTSAIAIGTYHQSCTANDYYSFEGECNVAWSIVVQPKYTKKKYACTVGKFAQGSTEYISGTGCYVGTTQSEANSNNSNEYYTCTLVESSSCNSYNGKCWARTRYYRTGCSTYSGSPSSTETGITNCEESNGMNYKITCTREN